MEYSQEYAVLECAFHLADEAVPGGLANFTRTSPKRALDIVKEAVEEIRDGLEENLSTERQNHWSFKLCTVLMTKLIETHCHRGGRDSIGTNNSFLAVTCGLPSCSKLFYFEIFRTCRFHCHFVEILGCLPPPLAYELIQDAIGNSDTESDVSFITKICEFLFLQENLVLPHILHKNQVESNAFLNSILAVVNKGLENTRDNPKTGVILSQSLMNLITLSVSNCCQVFRSGVNIYKTCREKSLLVSNLDINEETIDAILVEIREWEEDALFTTVMLEGSLDIGEAAQEILLSLVDIGGYTDNKVLHNLSDLIKKGFDSSYSDSIVKRKYSSKEHILTKRVCTEFLRALRNDDQNRTFMQQDCGIELQKIYPYLKPVFQTIDQCEQQQKVSKTDGKKHALASAIWRVDEKLAGYQACWHWLLTTTDEATTMDPRWIECIDRNAVTLASTKSVLTILECHLVDNKSLDVPLQQRIIQVMLRMFEALPLLLQTEVHQWIQRTRATGGDIVTMTTDFKTDLTATFNRLVQGENLDQLLKKISCLALQSPRDTLTKAVIVAVGNTDQATLVGQILQGLPTVCQTSLSATVTLLGFILMAWLQDQTHLQTNAEKAFLRFCKILLQPYRCNLNYVEDQTMRSLLSLQELFQSILQPALGLDCFATSKRQFQTRVALKLLRVVIETLNEPIRKEDQFTAGHLIPMVQSLCQLIDMCWDHREQPVEGSSDVVVDYKMVREETTQVLQELVSYLVVNVSLIQAKSLVWLYNSTVDLRWTTRLHLMPLYRSCKEKHFPLVISKFLSDVVTLNPADWVFVSTTGEDNMMDLLELCRVSEETLNMSLTSINPDCSLLTAGSLYSHLVTALCQVLPDCIVDECLRIMKLVQHLLTQQVLTVKYRPVFKQAASAEDAAAVETDLCLCQLLADMVQLMGGAPCEQWMTPQIWAHVTKNYAAIIKGLSMESSTVESFSGSQRAHFVSQLVCHVCKAMAVIPSAAGEQLFVLALDLLHSYMSETPEGADENILSEWEAMVQAVHLCEDEQQKQTLLHALSSKNENELT